MNGGATVPNDNQYDLHDARREIREIKEELREFKSTWRTRDEKKDEKIHELSGRVQQVESDVAGLREMLGEIKGDTKWLRRAITTALIGAIVSVVGGLFLFFLQNGFNSAMPF
jgi:predicted nuclease with TOPRIM domain